MNSKQACEGDFFLLAPEYEALRMAVLDVVSHCTLVCLSPSHREGVEQF